MEKSISFINKYPEVYRRVADMVDSSQGLELCAERVISKILRKLEKKFDEGVIGTHSKFRITQITKMEIGQAYKEKKAEIESCHYDDLAIVRSDGETIEFQAEDVLANVEDKIFGTEDDEYIEKTIALLAKNDRESHALKGWALGLKSKEIAEELAFLFGGKVSTHMVYLTDFKARCKRRYVLAAS